MAIVIKGRRVRGERDIWGVNVRTLFSKSYKIKMERGRQRLDAAAGRLKQVILDSGTISSSSSVKSYLVFVFSSSDAIYSYLFFFPTS